MTAPADVLAVLRRMSNQAAFARGSTVEFSCEDRLRQSEADAHALDAVAELIAACDERDSARRAYDKSPHETGPMLARVLDADKRYFAALAACKPATGA